jgi:hypothetical protein
LGSAMSCFSAALIGRFRLVFFGGIGATNHLV